MQNPESPKKILEVRKSTWTSLLAVSMLASRRIPAFLRLARSDDSETVTYTVGQKKITVVFSERVARQILTNRREYPMSGGTPEVLSQVFGEEGTLTTVNRTSGARAVQEFLGPTRLKDANFAIDMQSRIDRLFDRLAHSDQPYDEVMREVRSMYLNHLFFADRLKPEEMQTVVYFAERAFNLALPLSIVGANAADFFRIRRKKAQDILTKLVSSSKALTYDYQLEQAQCLLDYMIGLDTSKLSDNGQPFGNLDENSKNRQIRKWVSNSGQLVFAAIDTTSSLIGYMLHQLSKDAQLQQTLRQAAQRFVDQKQSSDSATVLNFSDINTSNLDPDIAILMRFIIDCLHNNPPTYLDARGKGDQSYIIDLAAVVDEQLRNNPELHETANLQAVLRMLVFGAGEKVCKGASFAVFEALMTLIIFLTKTTNISLKKEGRSTYRATHVRRGDVFELEQIA